MIQTKNHHLFAPNRASAVGAVPSSRETQTHRVHAAKMPLTVLIHHPVFAQSSLTRFVEPPSRTDRQVDSVRAWNPEPPASRPDPLAGVPKARLDPSCPPGSAGITPPLDSADAIPAAATAVAAVVDDGTDSAKSGSRCVRHSVKPGTRNLCLSQ